MLGSSWSCSKSITSHCSALGGSSSGLHVRQSSKLPDQQLRLLLARSDVRTAEQVADRIANTAARSADRIAMHKAASARQPHPASLIFEFTLGPVLQR